MFRFGNALAGAVIVVTGAVVLLLLALGGTPTAAGSVTSNTTDTIANVTTAAYDDDRDSWDQNEPNLSPSVVSSGDFGELFARKLNGEIYSQPLVFDGDVIVTTETARAYALNAQTGAIVWQRDFGIPTTAKAVDCSSLVPYVGSTSTPVIDPVTGTIYMTTRLQVGGSAQADSHWYLQAISSATGKELPGFPAEIAGTPSNTPGVPFDEINSEQRPGLLLLGGVVYIAFASDCDNTPYRGVVVGVGETSGAITSMWSDESGDGTDADSQAGIWQSGGGLVSTAPNQIILTTSNGVSPSSAPSDAPPATLSESVVALTVGSGGQLTPTQFFAPSDAPLLDEFDEDFGSGGPLALPRPYFGTSSIPQLIVQVGKSGNVFLLNAANMGGYRQGPSGGNDVLEEIGPYAGVWGHPAAYGGQGGWVYILQSAGGGYLQALSYGVNGSGTPALTPVATSTQSFGYTSGSPLVTSSGTTAGSNVVWVVYAKLSSSAHHQPTDGQLMAFSGTPGGSTLPMLWSASIGFPVKFSTPTASNGIVYVANAVGDLLAFGPTGKSTVQAAPVNLGSVPVGGTGRATLTLRTTRPLTLTGQLVTYGLQGLTARAPVTRAKGRTAGPQLIEPSGNVSLAPGVISLEQPRAGTRIAPGAKLAVRVLFRPRRAGTVEGLIRIQTSDGPRTVSFSGYGTAPGIGFSARPLGFGVVSTSLGGRTLAIDFTNTWTAPERITGFRLPGRPYRVIGLPRVGTLIAPRGRISVAVVFSPRHPGSYNSQLTVETNHGSGTIRATGIGVVGRPKLRLGETRIDFGRVAVGQTRTAVFRIFSTGAVPVTITRAIAPAPPFGAPEPLSEGISIDPGLAARVRVSFTPTHRGRFSGAYRIDSDGGHGYVWVRFSGDGT